MSLRAHLLDLIAREGPLSVATYMGLANAAYYGSRDPFGAGGDFTTAPEISQIFGETIGLALVDHWERAGRAPAFDLVELGPGRGTLMADALRAAAVRPGFVAAARVTMVETSAALRERQRAALPGAAVAWVDRFDGDPQGRPLYLIANEFFDALPIRQFVKSGGHWRERVVAADPEGRLAFAASPPLGPAAPIPSALRDAPDGSIVETHAPAQAFAAEIGGRIAADGGLALIVDYGYASSAPGETLQAVKAHRFADPLAEPGEADLTAHVDFEALSRAAQSAGARALGPVEQGAFLRALGALERAEALARRNSEKAEAIRAGARRLTDSAEMGSLFKVMAVASPDGPEPAGFA